MGQIAAVVKPMTQSVPNAAGRSARAVCAEAVCVVRLLAAKPCPADEAVAQRARASGPVSDSAAELDPRDRRIPDLTGADGAAQG